MDEQLMRAAVVGGGVAVMPYAWKAFCRLLYWCGYALGRLARQVAR